MITPLEVEAVIIERGEIIEDYPDDPRGPSSLLLGRESEKRPIHVVCAPKEHYLAIITAYLPEPAEWSDDFRRRTKR